MSKIVEFEHVYIELPEEYTLESEEEVQEEIISTETPEVAPLEVTNEEEEIIEEQVIEEETKEEVTEESKKEVRIELPSDQIIREAIADLEKEEKEESDDPAVSKSQTTRLSFAEIQKRLNETQSLHF